MRVLLISPNKLDLPHPVYPLGLDYVAGAISPPHEVRILDLMAAGTPEALERTILDFQPEVVGLTLRNIDNADATGSESYLDVTGSVVQRIRQVSRAKIVLGGSGFSILPAETLSRLEADYGVVGEGERLVFLLEALSNGADPAGRPGVLVRGEKTVREAGPWSGAVIRREPAGGAGTAYYLRNGGILNMQTKRGCPFRCLYCTYPLIEGHKLRRFAARDVAAEALALEQAGARFLFIVDSVFNADIEHSLAVARAFRQAGLKTPWGAFFTPKAPPAGYFEELARAGLTHIEFGTDSLDPDMLQAYRKPFTVAEVFQAHQAAVAAGVNAAHFLLLGGPGETRDTLTRTLDHAEKLSPTVVFFYAGVRIYPGTALCRLALEEKSLAPGQDLLAGVFYRPKSLTLEEMADLARDRARGRFNWVVGGGGQVAAALIKRLRGKGHPGPLWEKLIR
ncbi:MAG: lipid biosynthesis B12-binding/radical SAM protein [Thermodesulfobacteriota bacterium]